jgi:hypothetical protein
MKSRIKEGKIVTTVNNGNNNIIKAKGGITSIGQQFIKCRIQNRNKKRKQIKNNGAIWFDLKEPVKSFTGREK